MKGDEVMKKIVFLQNYNYAFDKIHIVRTAVRALGSCKSGTVS